MRTVVGVLRGGTGEYDLSLRSGASALEALDTEKYEPRDIFISRDGQWHLYGAPVSPERATRGLDVALALTHGEDGEGSTVQHMLETLGVPYAGSSALTSGAVYNKQRLKKTIKKLGIKTARTLVVEPPSTGEALEKMGFEIFRSFPHPAVVRPSTGGGSAGVTFADSYHALLGGLEKARHYSPRVLVEEHIAGRGGAVGVIDNFRDQKSYALIPAAHSAHGHHTFGDFSHDEKENMTALARAAHEGLGCAHYSIAEFAVSAKRGIYFLDMQTLPVLGADSLWQRSLGAVGATLSNFLDHIISLVKQK